jgi:hypothetical protein
MIKAPPSPKRLYHGEGVMLADDVIRITVPLTESTNVTNGWRRTHNGRMRLGSYCQGMRIAVNACLSQIWGGGAWPKPWGSRFLLWAVRCTDTGKLLDNTNCRGSMKEPEDAIIRSKLIRDDTADIVTWRGDPEQRVESQWGELGGPATHIFIRRLAP